PRVRESGDTTLLGQSRLEQTRPVVVFSSCLSSFVWLTGVLWRWQLRSYVSEYSMSIVWKKYFENSGYREVKESRSIHNPSAFKAVALGPAYQRTPSWRGLRQIITTVLLFVGSWSVVLGHFRANGVIPSHNMPAETPGR